MSIKGLQTDDPSCHGPCWRTVLAEKVAMNQDGRAIPGQVLYGPLPRGLGLGVLEVVENAHQLLGVRAARAGAGRATPPLGDVDGVGGGGDESH